VNLVVFGGYMFVFAFLLLVSVVLASLSAVFEA
jgi:hypothetical protein